MSVPVKIWLYFITDSVGRSCYVNNGVVKKDLSQTPLKQDPNGWRDIEISFATNQRYFSLNRSFSVPMTFVGDGAQILRHFIYNGNGFEEELYLTILKRNEDPADINAGVYELEYSGRLDLSKYTDDLRKGLTCNCVEGGLINYMNIRDTTTYDIPCDETNPNAIKVIFDGTTLKDKLNFKCVDVNIQSQYYAVPLTFVSNEGDSVNISHNNQDYETYSNVGDYVANSANYFFKSWLPPQAILNGTFNLYNFETVPAIVKLWIINQKGDLFTVFSGILPATTTYGNPTKTTINVVNQVFNFLPEDRLFLLLEQYVELNVLSLKDSSFTLSINSKTQPTTAFALRPLDLLKAIVDKMTNGKYTAKSNFFTKHNNIVTSCGDAIRNTLKTIVPNYFISTSLQDWFVSYNSDYNLGFKIVDDVLIVEPKEDLYSDDNTEIVDLGEVSALQITYAQDMLVNTVVCGYPDQRYDKGNGKYEFNSTVKYELPITAITKEYNIQSKYRGDSLGIEFLRAGLFSNNSTDNVGDKQPFLINISDTKQAIQTPINTYLSFTVNSAPSLPVFYLPANNELVHNDKPLITGWATPGSKVGILINNVQEGYCVADADGFWQYQIIASLPSYTLNNNGVIIETGKQNISAAYANSLGIVDGGATLQTISIVIDTTKPSDLLVTYPDDNSYLYDNKPLLKGIGPAGTTFNLIVDGIAISITVNNSCHWQYQVTTPLSNGNHTIIGGNTINFKVDSNVAYPLITSFDNSFTFYKSGLSFNGVGIVGATVNLYLDYDTTSIGTATVDANGNWSITPVLPISDGSHILSTTLTNQLVYVTVEGYGVKRKLYSSISGVVDQTVFNIEEMTASRQIHAHGNYLKSILFQQKAESIKYLTNAKNGNLATTLAGITTRENADIAVSTLKDNLFLPFYFNFKTEVPYRFAKLMSAVGKGHIKFSYLGNTIYALPIGTLKATPAKNDSQQWKLLASPKNALHVLEQLSFEGIFTSDYMNNTLFISDLNPIHFVKYGFAQLPKYHSVDIYDDHFENRNNRFISQPNYLQKWQKSDIIKLQFITAGLGTIVVKIYNSEAIEVDSFNATVINDVSVRSPYVLQQIDIDLSTYDGIYMIGLFSGSTILMLSEWLIIDDVFEDTLLFEYTHTTNKQNTYFGNYKPYLRVEGLLLPWNPDSTFTNYQDEINDVELLDGRPYKKRKMILGDAHGLPDWMALKLNCILLLNRLNIDGERYTRTSDSKLEPTERVGYPMNYYTVEMALAINKTGVSINPNIAPEDVTIAYTLSAQAFGLGTGTINIELKDQ